MAAFHVRLDVMAQVEILPIVILRARHETDQTGRVPNPVESHVSGFRQADGSFEQHCGAPKDVEGIDPSVG